MYKGIDDKIKLDKEQIKAILADEDYSLILAGADSEKTILCCSNQNKKLCLFISK